MELELKVGSLMKFTVWKASRPQPPTPLTSERAWAAGDEKLEIREGAAFLVRGVYNG